MTEVNLTGSALAAVVDNTEVEVAVLDRDGVIVAVNDAWRQFAVDNGGSADSCGVGSSYLDVCDVADEGAAAVGAVLRAALRGDLDVAAVVEIPCHSPIKQQWFDVTISSRTSESGEAIGATVMLTPVTARKQAQPAAEASMVPVASNAPFSGAFSGSPAAMCIIEVHPPDEGVMVDVNQAFADLFGYRCAELIGQSATNLIHPADFRPSALLDAALAASKGEVCEYFARGRCADGSEIWLQRHVRSLDPDGHRHKIIVHVVDVTAEIEADLVQRRQEALTAALSSLRLRMLQGATRRDGLQLLCETAAGLLEGSGAVILTPDVDGDGLVFEASVGVSAAVIGRMSLRKSQGAMRRVFQTGEPGYLNHGRHPDTPATNQAVMDERRLGPILVAPLPGSAGTSGVLAIIRRSGAADFGDDDLDPARQLAEGAATAIELAEAAKSEARLQLLEDRERIGRDMHDNVIGRLFGTGMILQAASVSLGFDPEAANERIASAVDDIDQAIKDIRSSIYGVRSHLDWGKSVGGAILAVAADLSTALGFEPTVSHTGPIDSLPAPLVEDLIAVLREALTNTAKHANATAVTVEVAVTATTLRAEVVDNGCGTTVTAPAAEFGGNGLRNIADRAEAHAGNATITSHPGEGTIVTWTTPVPVTER